MPNTTLTPRVIANEALDVLRNSAVMANLVHRDFSLSQKALFATKFGPQSAKKCRKERRLAKGCHEAGARAPKIASQAPSDPRSHYKESRTGPKPARRHQILPLNARDAPAAL